MNKRMNRKQQVRKNLRHYTPYYRLIAAATVILVAVIVGSLMVGDSVRATLAKRVAERLGDTETILFSRNSFMNEELLQTALFQDKAKGYLLTNGFIAWQGTLLPVMVWGMDDSDIPAGTAKVNQALTQEMGGDLSDMVLRLPAAGLIPSGSLFVTKNYTASLRLTHGGVMPVEEGGNLSLKNEQTLPLNVFVNRNELGQQLEMTGKLNLILAKNNITAEQLNEVWRYAHSGLSLHTHSGSSEVMSDRVFLQPEVSEAILSRNAGANRLFSYLANTLERGGQSIPYSFVTALDYYQGEPLRPDEILLSDYAANRLKASVGDTLRMSYYTAHDLKTLVTQERRLRVKQIIPLTELQADSTLSAEFPGLSNVERCTDWDSDLPIDMEVITDEDEHYWTLYRNTPKAIIAYEAVSDDWSNSFGNTTAIRLPTATPDLSGLTAEQFGIQLIHPRQTAMEAASKGVDFSMLFLALGFFILVAAVLLMLVPLREMLQVRRGELALLQSLGFSRKQIARILMVEAQWVVSAAAFVGVVVGFLYTLLVMWLLGNVWRGATQTEGFVLDAGATTLFVGTGVGLLGSLLLLRWAVLRSLRGEIAKPIAKPIHFVRMKWGAILLIVIAVAAMVVGGFVLQSPALFVVVGVCTLAAATLWGNYLLGVKGVPSTSGFAADKRIWSSLYADRRQVLLSFLTLAIGVFTVFTVGLNRKGFADSSQLRTGTGGYTLWCETEVPIYHNLHTPQGRERLSLNELPANAEVLQGLRYSADDASCLNLNKVTQPTVLGVDMEALQRSDFQIAKLYHSAAPSMLLEQGGDADNPVYPALVDETVLMWSLGLALGDTLYYEGDRGEQVAICLMGTLSNSIFQGHILIDRSHFARIWPETTGSEVLLLKVDEAEKEQTKLLLSQALHEYGIRVFTTNERLMQFNAVTDTYLTIFLTLGALGLLVGIMSFIVVVRKNLAGRGEEISLYLTLGFTPEAVARLLYREQSIVPLYAIATGVVSALLGVGTALASVGWGVAVMVLLFTACFVLSVRYWVKKMVRNQIYNQISINR